MNFLSVRNYLATTGLCSDLPCFPCLLILSSNLLLLYFNNRSAVDTSQNYNRTKKYRAFTQSLEEVGKAIPNGYGFCALMDLDHCRDTLGADGPLGVDQRIDILESSAIRACNRYANQHYAWLIFFQYLLPASVFYRLCQTLNKPILFTKGYVGGDDLFMVIYSSEQAIARDATDKIAIMMRNEHTKLEQRPTTKKNKQESTYTCAIVLYTSEKSFHHHADLATSYIMPQKNTEEGKGETYDYSTPEPILLNATEACWEKRLKREFRNVIYINFKMGALLLFSYFIVNSRWNNPFFRIAILMVPNLGLLISTLRNNNISRTEFFRHQKSDRFIKSLSKRVNSGKTQFVTSMLYDLDDCKSSLLERSAYSEIDDRVMKLELITQAAIKEQVHLYNYNRFYGLPALFPLLSFVFEPAMHFNLWMGGDEFYLTVESNDQLLANTVIKNISLFLRRAHFEERKKEKPTFTAVISGYEFEYTMTENMASSSRLLTAAKNAFVQSTSDEKTISKRRQGRGHCYFFSRPSSTPENYLLSAEHEDCGQALTSSFLAPIKHGRFFSKVIIKSGDASLATQSITVNNENTAPPCAPYPYEHHKALTPATPG